MIDLLRQAGTQFDDQQIDVAIAVGIQRDKALSVKEKTNQLQILGQSPIAQKFRAQGLDEMKAYLSTVMQQAKEALKQAAPSKRQDGR